jgi:hypothetical protein
MQDPYRYSVFPSLQQTSYYGCWHDPTTVKAGIVSAVLEAGYRVKLAGGHDSPATLRAKVAEIQRTFLQALV